jgi:hypothetical protein
MATFMDDFEGSITSVKEVTSYVVGIGTELELEVKTKDVTNCCNLVIKLLINEDLFLLISKDSVSTNRIYR